MHMLSSIALLALSIPAVTPLKLNVTAIGAQNGSSTLECWQLDKAFNSSAKSGTAGTAAAVLGNVANATYTVIPASYDRGVHNAPYNKWVAIISGLAYITLPDDNSTSAYISGGEFGLIFAADTANVSRKGHRTQYPGNTETILFQIQTKDGNVPSHSLLHTGPCVSSEIGGFRGMASGNLTKS